jgi:putative transposase
MLTRKNIRLPEFEYTAGAFFITICTNDRLPLFGQCQKEDVILSSIGQIVYQTWIKLPELHPRVVVDEFVVMPNHIHGILLLESSSASNDANQNCSLNSRSGALASVIGSFKSWSIRHVQEKKPLDGRLWQRGYFEHIIRNEQALMNIRQYIKDNPVLWYLDELNPAQSCTGAAGAAPLR